MGKFILSVPWCCVLSIGLSIFSVFHAPLSLVPTIDFIVHTIMIPLSFLIHGILGFHIYRTKNHLKHCSHKKGRHIFFWLSVLLLVSSTLFHLSPWHDLLLKH